MAIEHRGITELFTEGIRQMLVMIYDNGQRMNANGEAFPAGIACAIEEVSVRLLGEDFDTYEDRVREKLKSIQIDQLAAELDDIIKSEG